MAVSQGITHSGVVTFHELAPSLTRIEVNLDVDPGSLIEKAARGMRHVKRAVRADLARYKAFIEMQELETGAWRGVIEDGELVEPHDDEYDEERDYSEVDDLATRPRRPRTRTRTRTRTTGRAGPGRGAPARPHRCFKKGAGARPSEVGRQLALVFAFDAPRREPASSNGSGNGKTRRSRRAAQVDGLEVVGSVAAQRLARKRGSSNGSGSPAKRSSSSTTRRRSSSRS